MLFVKKWEIALFPLALSPLACNHYLLGQIYISETWMNQQFFILFLEQKFKNFSATKHFQNERLY